MPLMQVKVNGVWVEIPALTGARGIQGDKGEKGEKGDKGDKGDTGQSFPTEQIDFLEEVLNLVTFSDSAKGKKAVNNLLASLRGEDPVEEVKNLVWTSVDASGAIFNGTGYQNEARINSTGAISTSNAANTTATGFIKVSGGDEVRVSGGDFMNIAAGNNANAIGIYGSTKNHLGTATAGGSAYGIFGNSYSAYKFDSVVEEKTGVYKWIVPPTDSGVEWIRISCYRITGAPGKDLIVTVNQEIT